VLLLKVISNFEMRDLLMLLLDVLHQQRLPAPVAAELDTEETGEGELEVVGQVMHVDLGSGFQKLPIHEVVRVPTADNGGHASLPWVRQQQDCCLTGPALVRRILFRPNPSC
jgi:hypothetical protein